MPSGSSGSETTPIRPTQRKKGKTVKERKAKDKIKKKVVEKKKKEEKVGTRIRRGLKPSRRIKNLFFTHFDFGLL